MAVTYTIYDETAAVNRTIIVDFLGNILAQSEVAFSGDFTYYFRARTSTRDTGGNAIPEVLTLSLDGLVLNGVKQARTNIATDYTDINDMIEDNLYDIVNGHAADKWSSGVTYRAPLQF